jgi:hypothetical protein
MSIDEEPLWCVFPSFGCEKQFQSARSDATSPGGVWLLPIMQPMTMDFRNRQILVFMHPAPAFEIPRKPYPTACRGTKCCRHPGGRFCRINHEQYLLMSAMTGFPRLIEFQKRFGDEAACVQYLAAARCPTYFLFGLGRQKLGGWKPRPGSMSVSTAGSPDPVTAEPSCVTPSGRSPTAPIKRRR